MEMYSSGEESMDRWTVETWRMYEVTRDVHADVTFRRDRQLTAVAAAAAAVDTARGMSRTLQCFDAVGWAAGRASGL